MDQRPVVNRGSCQVEFLKLRQMRQADPRDLRVVQIQVRQPRKPPHVNETRICQRRFVNLKMLKFHEFRQMARAFVRNLVPADQKGIQFGRFRDMRDCGVRQAAASNVECSDSAQSVEPFQYVVRNWLRVKQDAINPITQHRNVFADVVVNPVRSRIRGGHKTQSEPLTPSSASAARRALLSSSEQSQSADRNQWTEDAA